MDKATIEAYLRMLGQELAVNNRTGSILLVGGAVMILVVGNRNSTRDIDASFEREAQAIRAAITDIAYREGLPLDWLNDGAKGFLYKTPPVTLWKSFPGLNVYMPSLDYLLSMKIVAGRPQDIADARALVQYLGVDQPQAIIDMLKIYPSNLPYSSCTICDRRFTRLIKRRKQKWPSIIGIVIARLKDFSAFSKEKIPG